MLTCRPVQTGLQVDIEIYKDKLSQSGNRILSSHIPKIVSEYDQEIPQSQTADNPKAPRG